MKKVSLLVAGIIVGVSLMTGCSNVSDKVEDAEGYAAVAEEFEENITGFERQLSNLEKQDHLTNEDQEQLVNDIENVRFKIEEFLSVEPPFGLKMVQKKLQKEFDKREEQLLVLKDKAENNEATIKDIEKVNDEFFSNISVKLFN